MWKRIAFIAAFMGISFSLLYMRVYQLSQQDTYKKVGAGQGSYTLTVARTFGNIYDYRMRLLNNNTNKIMAVINPTADSVQAIQPYIANREDFYQKLENGVPFLCEVTSMDVPDSNILTFEVPVRTTEEQLAPHIIGYTSDNKGVSGIESSFDEFLRTYTSETTVTFSTDGMGRPLKGIDSIIDMDPELKAGVITTLDSTIQQVCEKVSEKMEKGAIVVMDPYNGQLRAVVSAPDFSPVDVASSLKADNAPLINRAFLPYNVGSVFKLVTAAAALEQGISPDLTYECTGSIDVYGQTFHCHKLSGHGVQNMEEAVVNSCNTYFIHMSEQLSAENFIAKASALGFGRSSILTNNIVSAKGNLQSATDLSNLAEKANLAFGQGKLMATPLQIAAMTSAIVNDGKLPKAQLVLGTTVDGDRVDTLGNETIFADAIDPVAALKLRKYMEAAVQNNLDSVARPYNTTAAGKTSTAQTGQYDKDGNEILQAWFTGYFPVDEPKYVVTVLVEGGGSGNSVAGPIFKEIAEEITKACL